MTRDRHIEEAAAQARLSGNRRIKRLHPKRQKSMLAA